MIFAAPWVLVALAALPVLWWLLRITPPAPRREVFPAIRLLADLERIEETPSRTPWWLLALRVLAAGLAILGLARPVLDAANALPGSGPVLLVIDDGWAAAPDWAGRMQSAGLVLDRAERAGRQVAVLATASEEDGTPPRLSGLMPPADLRGRLAALHPKPWPTDRSAAAAALRVWNHPGSSVVYVADGITNGEAFDAFASELAGAGAVTEICCAPTPARLLLPPRAEADRLVVRVAQAPQPLAGEAAVLAQSGDGRSLARVVIALPPGARTGEAAIQLPPEIRNRLARLILEGAESAGSVVLLDERWRRRPVGLLAGDALAAEAPLTGPLYFLRRALEPFTELREADLKTLLSRDLSVMILADRPLPQGEERDAIARWVDKGGLLIRFAGPNLAQRPDPLLPVTLLEGDRQLGGALSWSQPAQLAPFLPGTPFAGLDIPDEVRVTRQVLAEPKSDLAEHTWARLADGTPLVTETPQGAGRIVLFHVTANAEWSNLPLSGLFVELLRRLVQLSAGVPSVAGDTVLAPYETLSGYGVLGPPTSAATGLAADAFASTAASPRHPPGIYGPENGRQALNLGATMAPPEPAPTVRGSRREPLGAASPERALGPPLLAIAFILLAADLLLTLFLRGLLGRRQHRATVAGMMLVLALGTASAGAATPADGAPALSTRLAYIQTGDREVDGISRAGLRGLSEFVTARTAATLSEPDPVVPGEDDLSFYPLLYWPLTADAAPFSPPAAAALNDYMAKGGIILIDTRGSGSGADFAPGAAGALERASAGLAVPALAPLTNEHVLAHAFYLLQDFPGRYTGGTVWVQRDQDRANDSVSPVIVGGNDWAAAWAVDDAGRNPYAAIPGGAQQRVLAYRFGVNLVMYALTGNYKGDQVHVPAILERLGQ